MFTHGCSFVLGGKCLYVTHAVLVIVCLRKILSIQRHSFCLRDNSTCLLLTLQHVRHTERFTVSSLHPDLHFHSFYCWKAEAAMLTVTALQSPFNGTSIPASPGTLTGGRWGEWLWLLATADQPAAAHMHPLTSRQRHIRLCELPNLRHSCQDAVWARELSRMTIVSSAREAPWAEDRVSSHPC